MSEWIKRTFRMGGECEVAVKVERQGEGSALLLKLTGAPKIISSVAALFLSHSHDAKAPDGMVDVGERLYRQARDAEQGGTSN